MKYIATAVFTTCSIACGAYEPTPSDLVEIARIDSVRNDLALETANAVSQSQSYGGLIATLADLRLETLRTTDALLQQRVEALRSGARVDLTVGGSAPDSARARALRQELQEQHNELERAERDAARYAGGLIQAVSLMEVATVRQTIAMLNQERLIAEFGLPFFTMDAPTPELDPVSDLTAVPQGVVSPTPPSVPSPPSASFDIADVTTRVTERNQVWWRYAWRLTLRNTGEVPLSLDATIEFQDTDGFVIDTDDEYNLYIDIGEERTFTGSAMIDVASARNIAQVNAKVRR